MERIDTVVVGAGQAGLATSYFLTQHGRDHLVLEGGEVAETWRSRRWDGFYLNTPNWSLTLPGGEYAGDDPDAFAALAEVVGYLEEYASSFEAPVRERVRVDSLRRTDDEYVLVGADLHLSAKNVVVATGAFQQPRPPVPGTESADVELQLTTSEYRGPGDEHGWPVQRRGVSEHPGLYFVGVNWLHKRKSALFCGVGEDAEHVAVQLAG
ncbi:MAG TPA: NAD(P)-binding domain-containing protein [Gaiellaceae bacterium]|nr:NAD(P)-binding domain-containing protein [Gaiellaceae bacterium]